MLRVQKAKSKAEREEKRAERVALEQDRAAALQAKMLREAPIIERARVPVSN